jgi:hypothetical protein
MKAVNAHERSLAGLARSVRAAIVVPSLFALAPIVFKQPELAVLRCCPISSSIRFTLRPQEAGRDKRVQNT